MKILIVDDSPITRTMLRDLFEILGHQVVAEAENLPTAVAAFKAHRPDLTTLDLSLVGESGLEVLKVLRAEDPNAKVMIVSGNAQKRVYEVAAASGAKGFLQKPFNLDDLTAALAALEAKA